MDHFLLVTTPAWVEVPNFVVVIQQHAVDQIQGWINDGEWGQLTESALYWGIVDEYHSVVDARLFITGEEDNPLRFWMTTAPIV